VGRAAFLGAVCGLLWALPAAATAAAPQRASTSVADEERPSPRAFVGLGVLVYGGGRYSDQVTGAKSHSAFALPELSLSGRLPLMSGWGWAPLLAFTPLGRKSDDEGQTTYVLRIEAKITRSLAEILDLQAGIGLTDAIIAGSGGTIELGNGESKSVFGFPTRSSASILFYWQLGAGAELMRALRVDASVFVQGALSSERAFNYTLQMSYGFL
jgi:hypothetical protein